MSDKLNDYWIKPSFNFPMNPKPDKSNQNVKQKSRKRQLNEETAEETVTKTSDNFKSDSICLIDSMSAKNSSELAFSRYKLNELSDWFRNQFVDNKFNSKYLVLNGPTGTGKTTSLKVLAKEFKVEVIEYKSYSQEFETFFDEDLTEKKVNLSGDSNQLENFKQFIADSIRYKTRLDFVSNDVVIGSTSNQNENRFTHRLILIEEFPNLFFLKPETLHKELRLLDKRFGKRLIPIVFIISETISGHSEEYKLLPKALQTELRMKSITFPPITEASLHKTLQRLSDNQLPKIQIQKVIDGASGDIRCAINNMQLLYMHSIDNKCDKSGKKCRKTKETIVSNNDFISRDSSLTISHAIGKVLYAKRIDSQKQSNSNNSELNSDYKLPPHLSDKERVPLIDNPDSISDKIMVSSDVFNAWLHQNYIEFCDSLDCAQNCIDWLCECDALFSGEHHFNNKSIFESYKSSLAMRGLAFNLSTTGRYSNDAKQASNVITSKPKLGFKPFSKPQVFVVNRLANSLKRQTSESLSKDRLFWSTKSIVIDLMPFVSQMPKHLQKTGKQFRYVLDKVVTYERKGHQINEQDLCNALSLSSVSNSFDETNDEMIFHPNANEDKNGANVIQINKKAIDPNDYTIDDSDSN